MGSGEFALASLGEVAKRDVPATVVALNNAMPASCRAVSTPHGQGVGTPGAPAAQRWVRQASARVLRECLRSPGA
jgi:hypothetical protein